MTVKAVDANPNRKIDWSQIKWEQLEETVQRIQARIVKALKNNEFRKVKDLQRLLTKSLSARLLAVKRVTTNSGRRTAGVDGVKWTTKKQKTQAVYDLEKEIKSKPLRRIYIPKKNGKMRPISIPTMLDRAQQACHLLALDPIAETRADEHSYGFRPKRGAHDAIGYIHHILRRQGSPQWILEADIKACFDEINHEWLLDNVPMDKSVLKKWLKSGYIEEGKLFPSLRGTPQGGIASPTLANITLDGLERTLKEKFGDNPGQVIRKKVHVCRYADDFIVTGASKELLEESILPAIKQFLSERGLQISKEKTRIVNISEGFDFLGQNTKKYGKKVLTKPSDKSISNLKEKLKETVKRNHGRGSIHLIKDINPIIRGWCNYHRYIVSRKTFETIDHYVYILLWKWARRQHPNKSRKWVARRYFLRPEGKRWVFSAKNKQGIVQQYQASSTRIRRHILIKGKANPYETEYREYFEKRAKRKSAPCAA